MEKPEAKEELPVVYSNAVHFHTSRNDFSMLFGLTQPPLDPKEKVMVIVPQIRVILSPIHFKEFISVAARQLESYEAAHGEIPTPKTRPAPKKKRTKE